MLADALSQNSVKQMDAAVAENCEYTICFLIKWYPIGLEQVAKATAEEKELQQIIAAINEGWPPESKMPSILLTTR